MGEFFALMAALVWASAVIFFKRSGETIAPFALNLFRVTVSMVVFIPCSSSRVRASGARPRRGTISSSPSAA